MPAPSLTSILIDGTILVRLTVQSDDKEFICNGGWQSVLLVSRLTYRVNVIACSSIESWRRAMAKLLTMIGGLLGGIAALLVGINELSKAWAGFDLFHPQRTPYEVHGGPTAPVVATLSSRFNDGTIHPVIYGPPNGGISTAPPSPGCSPSLPHDQFIKCQHRSF